MGRKVCSVHSHNDILFGTCGSDEYILPKIAERELRRFANLRSTSSKLGVRLPLDKVLFDCSLILVTSVIVRLIELYSSLDSSLRRQTFAVKVLGS